MPGKLTMAMRSEPPALQPTTQLLTSAAVFLAMSHIILSRLAHRIFSSKDPTTLTGSGRWQTLVIVWTARYQVVSDPVCSLASCDSLALACKGFRVTCKCFNGIEKFQPVMAGAQIQVQSHSVA